MENNMRYFQWIAGDKKSEIMVFDKIRADGADLYIVFKDGSRINENLVASLNQLDLTDKLMAEIDHPKNCWKFKEEWVGREEEVWQWRDETNPVEKVCVQPFVPGRKIVKLIPPEPTPKKSSEFGVISNPTPPPIDAPISEIPLRSPNQIEKAYVNGYTSDPVYILISKAKKVDSDITMGMVVSLPPKNLYEIAKESFENGDEKFIDYIVDELTVDEIKGALKIAIREMYEGTQNQGLTV